MAASSLPRVRFWAGICGLFAIAFIAGLVLTIKNDVVMCSAEFVSLPEPADWRTWPKLDKLGGYEIKHEQGNCVGHGIQCGLVDTELRDASVCPRGGVSLDGYFDGDIYQGEFDLSLFASGDITVVSHHDSMKLQGSGHGPSIDDENFLVAFKKQKTITHPVFEDVRYLLLASSLAIALIGLIFSENAARRELVHAAAIRDSAQYKSAVRNKSGAITFEDGTVPIAASGASDDDFFVGPVMVRIAAITAGHYRESPSTIANDIVDGDRESAAQRLTIRANFFLKRAAIMSGLLCVAIAMTTVLWALSQFRLD